MRILIADDDLFYRQLLAGLLTEWGYEVILVADGQAACQVLQAQDAPELAIIDWMMPGNHDLEVCRKVREWNSPAPTYLILLTARTKKEDTVAGLESGADDYLAKPFDQDELRARLHVGQRIVALQRNLADRVRELADALAQVQHLQGLLPICSYCKSIRNDQNYWQQVETYIADRSEAKFSHGICPACYEKIVKPMLAEL